MRIEKSNTQLYNCLVVAESVCCCGDTCSHTTMFKQPTLIYFHCLILMFLTAEFLICNVGDLEEWPRAWRRQEVFAI